MELNSTILAKAWLKGSNDFQQAVPSPTQAGIRKTMQFLVDPMNGNYYNEFLRTLVNVFGSQYVHQTRFENPLGTFKKRAMEYGTSAQEIAVGWVKGHSYDLNAGAELLKLVEPNAVQWFHTMNRQEKFPISVSYDALRGAFYDPYGLNRLITAIVDGARVSDNYTEYRCMMQLFAEYNECWSMFTHQCAMPYDEQSGKEFLTALQAYAGKLAFPSSRYIGADVDIPVTVQPNELCLLITPDADASLNVNTLAGVFNVDLADVKYRKVLVDEFPLPDMFAALTTDAFFMCWDNVYRTGAFWNEENLTNKYYLHHWETISCSPFVPLIAFRTSTPSTVFPVVTETVTGLSLTAASEEAKPGDIIPLTIDLQGALAASNDDAALLDDLSVAPDAATFEIAAIIPANGDAPAVPVQLNSRTYVDRLFNLNVQKSGLKKGTVLTVTATSTYTNPSGETTPQTASVDITITEDSL